MARPRPAPRATDERERGDCPEARRGVSSAGESAACAAAKQRAELGPRDPALGAMRHPEPRRGSAGASRSSGSGKRRGGDLPGPCKAEPLHASGWCLGRDGDGGHPRRSAASSGRAFVGRVSARWIVPIRHASSSPAERARTNFGMPFGGAGAVCAECRSGKSCEGVWLRARTLDLRRGRRRRSARAWPDRRTSVGAAAPVSGRDHRGNSRTRGAVAGLVGADGRIRPPLLKPRSTRRPFP